MAHSYDTSSCTPAQCGSGSDLQCENESNGYSSDSRCVPVILVGVHVRALHGINDTGASGKVVKGAA